VSYPGCYLCGLSVADALVLGTMIGTIFGQDDPVELRGRRPILVCPMHRDAITHVNKAQMARVAQQITGFEIRVRPDSGAGVPAFGLALRGDDDGDVDVGGGAELAVYVPIPGCRR
jgi:hypothetical protein